MRANLLWLKPLAQLGLPVLWNTSRSRTGERRRGSRRWQHAVDLAMVAAVGLARAGLGWLVLARIGDRGTTIVIACLGLWYCSIAAAALRQTSAGSLGRAKDRRRYEAVLAFIEQRPPYPQGGNREFLRDQAEVDLASHAFLAIFGLICAVYLARMLS